MELSLPFPRRASRRRTRHRTISNTHLGSALDRLGNNRLALRVAVCAIVVVPLLGGGWLWLRDSPLVSVRHVHITGVHGVQAIEIREALDDAATRMTTMDFNVGALRTAVSSFAIVGALHVKTSFPHTVSIFVSERPPVAVLVTAGQRTAVAADGTVLGTALLSSSLPTVNGSVEPPAGARLREPAAVTAVTVLGTAPAALAPFVVRVFNGPEGLTVAMRNGLLVYFGNSMRPHAKWLSLARVLTSPSAAGAWYVDVRLPERPAAGLSSASPSSTSTPVETGASDPTAAALAASLAKAAGGSTGASAVSSTTSGSGESETSSGSSTTSGSGENESSSGSSEHSEAGGGESSSSSPGGTTSGQSGGTTEAPATSTSPPSSTRSSGG